MAQVFRTSPLVATASAPGARMAAGLRNVATVDRMPVEGMSAKNGTFLDDAGFLYQEYTRDDLQGGVDYGAGGRGRRTPLPSVGMMRTTSQAFAAFLEFERVDGVQRGSAAGGARLSGVAISQAIDIYETNSRVIGDGAPSVGSSLSMML